MTLKEFYNEVESGSYKNNPEKAMELYKESTELQHDLVDRFKDYKSPMMISYMIDAYLKDCKFNEFEIIKLGLYLTNLWREAELFPELKDYIMKISICLN